MDVPTSKARGITARLNPMGGVDFATDKVLYREIEGNTTAADTVAFVEMLAGQADPACPTVLLMDQASIHTSARVGQHRQKWREHGLLIAYLPSYSPELNPLEGQWRKLKYHDLPHRQHASKADLRGAVGAPKWGTAA
ncbi:Transposase [Deinococcus hopiensis KR-140]|uniref:Transposase n=2 Tax=Deinococcus TaxID=1298 RepID=A0A1W1UDY3_9DEIO|nr:Transposase [Deinococcus hopiensis KR-140]